MGLFTRRGWLAKREGRQVVVHTTGVRTGARRGPRATEPESLSGTLATVAPDVLVLEDAVYLEDGEAPELEGTVVLGRDRVAWLQVLST